MHIVRVLMWSAALAVVAATPAGAQVITAEISGVVTDTGAGVLPGATVIARNTNTGFERVAVSTDKGRYALLSLPTGPYTVTVSLPGFNSVKREGFSLSLNETVVLDFQLAPASVVETVTVTGEVPLISTTNGTIGKTLGTEVIDSVPSLGRNYQNLVALAPGVRGTESTNPRIGGNAYYANSWKIDGMENDQESVAGVQSRVTQDAVAEVQVLTNQFSAEFSRALGGAVNVITRSGTNTFDGRAFYYGQNGEWNEKNFFARSAPKPTNKTKQYGGTSGGPIRRDMIHYFASVERIETDNPITLRTDGQSVNLISPFRGWSAFGKVTHQLSTRHTLQLSYLLDKNVTENANVGGIGQIENGYLRTNRNDNLILSDVGVLSPTVVNEFRVMWQRNDRVADPNSAIGPQISRPSARTGRNSGGRFGQKESKIQLNDTLTKIRGNHNLKAGINLQVVYGSEWFFETNFGGAYVFDTDRPFNAADPSTYPIQYNVGTGTPNASIDNNILGIFVQDAWQVHRSLTVNAGLRYDRESGEAVKTFLGFPDNDNIAPRLSFAWSLDEERRTAIRGGAGRFYYRMNGNLGVNMIVQGAPPPDGIGTTVQTTINFPGYPDPLGPNPRGASSSPVRLKTGGFSDGNEQTPYADQFSVGVARQLGRHSAVSADFVSTRGKHYVRAADRNFPDPATGLRPKAGYGQYWVYETEGRMWYDALLVKFDKRMANRHQYSVTYTLSSTEDDTWPQFITQGGGPQAWYNPGAERAYSATSGLNADDHERHRVTVNGIVQLPFGFDLSGVLMANSARRFNITTGRDNNGDGVLADRPNLVNGAYVDPGTGPAVQGSLGKNAGIRAGYLAVDARLAKEFRIQNLSVRIIGEAFNLTNRVNYNTFQGNIQSAQFNTAISALRPRTIQLGAQFDF